MAPNHLRILTFVLSADFGKNDKQGTGKDSPSFPAGSFKKSGFTPKYSPSFCLTSGPKICSGLKVTSQTNLRSCKSQGGDRRAQKEHRGQQE